MAAQLRRAAALGLVVMLGGGVAGCAVSGRLSTLLEGDAAKLAEAKAAHDRAKAGSEDTTGSISGKDKSDPSKSGLPPESDLAYTKAAVSDVLNRGGKDASAPWENPRSGARGTVTPIAVAYTVNGLTCRDFLASYVATGAEAWMQGEACRADKGRWEVKTLKPWRRT